MLNTILLTFNDPELEATYLAAARGAQVPVIRRLCIMGAAVLIVYLIVNPAFLDKASVVRFAVAAAIFIAVMALYYFIAGTSFHATVRSMDFSIFLSLHLIQTSMNFSQFLASSALHLTPMAIVDLNSAVLMFFGAAAFAGSIFWFAAWAGSALLICTAVSLYLGDYSLQSVYGLLPVLTAYVLSIFLNWTIENKNREIYLLHMELDQRKRLSGA